MEITGKLTLAICAGVLAACGSGTAAVGEAPQTHSPTAAESATPVSAAPVEEAAPASVAVRHGQNPSLTVYVQGPNPVEYGREDATARRFELEMVVVNEGDAPTDIEDAHAWFEAYRGSERIPCTRPLGDDGVEGPLKLQAGDAHTFRAEVVCPLPLPGEYEVRAYLSFGTADPDLDLERYYAGRYTLTVESSS